MMAELLLVFCVLLVVAWACAPRAVPWVNALTRRKPGAGADAEWMAPRDVVRAVKRDYLAALIWLAETEADWGRFARQLDRHTAGSFLQRQTAALNNLVEARGPRLAARVEAYHRMSVRRFTSDGLHCLLIDRQTERVMLMRGYWSGRSVRCQRLPDAALVWEMGYDLASKRWKINRLVQALPPRAAMGAPLGVRVTVSAELPLTVGRDN